MGEFGISGFYVYAHCDEQSYRDARIGIFSYPREACAGYNHTLTALRKTSTGSAISATPARFILKFFQLEPQNSHYQTSLTPSTT